MQHHIWLFDCDASLLIFGRISFDCQKRKKNSRTPPRRRLQLKIYSKQNNLTVRSDVGIKSSPNFPPKGYPVKSVYLKMEASIHPNSQQIFWLLLQ